MAKTIKITFYNPKELWRMFWNWVYWPRRKKCAEWMECLQYDLETDIISDILIKKYYNGGLINDELCEKLELDIRPVIRDACNKFVKVLNTPMPLDNKKE